MGRAGRIGQLAGADHEARHAVVAALLDILPDKSIITLVGRRKDESGSVSFGCREALAHNSVRKWSARYTRKVIVEFTAVSQS
jgi:hypothetical protein